MFLFSIISMYCSLTVGSANGYVSKLNYNCGQSIKKASKYIIGGSDALDGEFPFMVSLQYNKSDVFHHFCGATLLNQRWILTAAHCIEPFAKLNKRASDISAIVATVDNSNHQNLYAIEKWVIHGCFDKREKYGSDIGLLKTKNNIKMNDKFGVNLVNVVCLPPQHSKPISDKAIIIGWGIFKPLNRFLFLYQPNSKPSNILQKAETSIYSVKYCHIFDFFRQYGFTYMKTKNTICIRNRKVSSCMGDSGGPLLQAHNGRFYQLGVTSYGDSKCSKYKPDYFTEVSHYRNWIEDSINKYDTSKQHQITTQCDSN